MQDINTINKQTTNKGRPQMNLVWPTTEKFTIDQIHKAQSGIAKGTINGKIAKAVTAGVIVKVGVQKLATGKGRPFTIFSINSIDTSKN